MKILLVLMILVILFSLGSALFYLIRDQGTTDRTVRALTWRVGLSISLFALVLLGLWLGILPGH
jgi:hypothetical protein